jgi:hypothetical protein
VITMGRSRRSTTHPDYQLGFHIDLDRDSRTTVPEEARVRPAPIVRAGDEMHGRIGALLAKVLDWILELSRIEAEIHHARASIEKQVTRFRAHVESHGHHAASTRRRRRDLRWRVHQLRARSAAARELASQVRGALDLIHDYRTHVRGSHGPAAV